jgi:hypothetical protein
MRNPGTRIEDCWGIKRSSPSLSSIISRLKGILTGDRKPRDSLDEEQRLQTEKMQLAVRQKVAPSEKSVTTTDTAVEAETSPDAKEPVEESKESQVLAEDPGVSQEPANPITQLTLVTHCTSLRRTIDVSLEIDTLFAALGLKLCDFRRPLQPPPTPSSSSAASETPLGPSPSGECPINQLQTALRNLESVSKKFYLRAKHFKTLHSRGKNWQLKESSTFWRDAKVVFEEMGRCMDDVDEVVRKGLRRMVFEKTWVEDLEERERMVRERFIDKSEELGLVDRVERLSGKLESLSVRMHRFVWPDCK